MRIVFCFTLPLLFIIPYLGMNNVLAQKEIFISEITISRTESAVELFNPFDSVVSLSGYSLRMAINQSRFPASHPHQRYLLLDNYSIDPNKTLVIVNRDVPDLVKNIADIILSDDNTIQGDYILHLFEGNDAIALFKGNQVIDIIGEAQSNQLWDIAGVKDATWLRTLIRKPHIKKGNSDWHDVRGFVDEVTGTLADSSEWIVMPGITYDFLGTHPDDLFGQKDIFISELTISRTESAIELFNPTNAIIDLNSYNIRMAMNQSDFPASNSHNRYLSLDGHVIEPYQTLVIVNKDVPEETQTADIVVSGDNDIPGDNILHLYEGDDAIALYKGNLMIDVFGEASSNQIWDVAGVQDATWLKTFIRKPNVWRGNHDWNDARGYMNEKTGTLPDSSEWIVLPAISYKNLGSHYYLEPNSAGMVVRSSGLRLLSGKSNVNFGLVEIGDKREVSFVVTNNGDSDLLIDSIFSANLLFEVQAEITLIAPGATDTFNVSYSPKDNEVIRSEVLIVSNDFLVDTFSVKLLGFGTSGLVNDTIKIHVSPVFGDDQNSGESKETSFKTLKKAVDHIKELGRPPQFQLPLALLAEDHPINGIKAEYHDAIKAHTENLTMPVLINLYPGYHFLDQPIIIDPEIGGNIHFKGIWEEGAEDEIRLQFDSKGLDPFWLDLPIDKVPVISGGQIIKNWTESTVNGHYAWVAELPEVASGDWYFRQLFVNGRRAERSRWPKRGTFRITEILPTTLGEVDPKTDRVRLKEVDMLFERNIKDIEWVGLHRWVSDRIPVESWDASSNVLTLRYLPKQYMYSSAPVHRGGLCPYYFEHVFETLSEPGEWYLDRIEGKLYYIPRQGETIENMVIIAPKIENLVTVEGNSGTNDYIWSVSYHRIGFMHTLTDLEKHLRYRLYDNPSGGAVAFRAARAPLISACYFGHLGDPAIEFGNGTMGGVISSCIFRDLGSSAMNNYMQGYNVDHTDRNAFNTLSDNDILGFGKFYEESFGIINLNVVYSQNEHNLIRDGYYSGIGCMVTSGTLFTGYHNSLRKNHIHTIGQGLLSDMGGIYTQWHQPGTVIENNLVHNIEARDYSGLALYLDKNSAYFTIRNNIFYNTNQEVINMKGHSHQFYNNLVAFSTRSAIGRKKSAETSLKDALGIGESPAELSNNIILQNGGVMFLEVEEGEDIQYKVLSNHNLFYNYNGPVQIKENQSIHYWRSVTGHDINSIVANPLLKDPFRGNFNLEPGSITETMGFSEIGISDVGPRKIKWETDGAIWINYPVMQESGFIPSDIKGLHLWITAKDLTPDKVFNNMIFKWEDRTYNKYNFYQYEQASQPILQPDGLNGNNTVRFNGHEWMSSLDKSASIQGSFGTFRSGSFSIFTVYRSDDGDQVLLCKGKSGTAGNWSIGENQNQFRWGENHYIGASGSDFKVRVYRRRGGQFEYLENGQLLDSSMTGSSIDFSQKWDHFFLGKTGNSESGQFNGEIAEIIIYNGDITNEETNQVIDYLAKEWGIDTTFVGLTLNEPEDKIELSIFPNPCGDFFTINHNTDLLSSSIYTLTGKLLRVIYHWQDQNETISMEGFRPGVYLLETKLSDGRINYFKIIKQ